MKLNTLVIALLAILSTLLSGCSQKETAQVDPAEGTELSAVSKIGATVSPDPREVHFGELRMLTDGGENAEAYFAFGSDKLIFQSTREPYACDQIFTMNLDGSEQRLVSTGTGRTTCAYYYPEDDWIVYDGKRYDVKTVDEYEYKTAWLIQAKLIEGNPVYQDYHVKTNDYLLELNQTATAVIV